MNRLSLLATALVIATPFAAKADTVINLNATNPNTSIGGTPNSLAPSFYSTISLGPGTYSVSVVGTSTAGALYNGWSQSYGADQLAAPGSWQERIGFNTTGGDSFSTAGGNYTYTYPNTDLQLFETGNGNCNVAGNCYNSATDALAAFTAMPYTFTLATTTTDVSFYIPDQSYPVFPGFTDNTGGVSLDLKMAAVTPEPSSLLLMATGALTAAGMIKRRIKA